MNIIPLGQVPVDPQEGFCPVSRTRGKRVDTATVKCLVSVSLQALRDVQYFFCRDAACPVVYFSADGSQTFDITQVREAVYQKDPHNDEVLVCYCFRFTLGEIRAQASQTSTPPVVDAINAGINAGQCACDWRNPQGDCCLGNVRAVVKQAHT